MSITELGLPRWEKIMRVLGRSRNRATAGEPLGLAWHAGLAKSDATSRNATRAVIVGGVGPSACRGHIKRKGKWSVVLR